MRRPRGYCPDCGHYVPLRKDGTTYAHNGCDLDWNEGGKMPLKVRDAIKKFAVYPKDVREE